MNCIYLSRLIFSTFNVFLYNVTLAGNVHKLAAKQMGGDSNKACSSAEAKQAQRPQSPVPQVEFENCGRGTLLQSSLLR